MSTAAPLIGLQFDALTTLARNVSGMPRPALGDVPPELLVRDVVGAFGLFRCEHTGDRAGGDRGRARSLGVVSGLPRADAERGSSKAAEPSQRAASADPIHVHCRERRPSD